MGVEARASAQRYAWPRVAERIEGVYETAVEVPEARSTSERAARRIGFVPANGRPPVPAQRLASLEPEPAAARRPRPDRAADRGRRRRRFSALA